MPPTPAIDAASMQRAIDLAAASTALASPNPQVGCVLTRDNIVLGEGAHLYANRDHAEIVALKQAEARGLSTAGATAFVTLEPCSHHGRTGPCADALIRAGITRCVIATQDPNPLVSGQGIARLRAAGIEVNVGLLQQPARRLNDAFAHFIQHRTPYVTLKAALSVDGRLAPPPTARFGAQPHWLSGPLARAEVHRLRHASDAILTGIGTVLADDPALTDRSNLPRRRPLLRVVLDTHLRIPLTSQLLRSIQSVPFPSPSDLLHNPNTDPSASTNAVADTDLIRTRASTDASINASINANTNAKTDISTNPAAPTSDLLILCGLNAPLDRIAALEAAGAEVQPILGLTGYARHLSLPAVLETLGDRNLLSLLLETGSHLNGAFLTHHLVDKAVLFYADTELGEGSLPFAHGIPSPFLFQQTLDRVTQDTLGPDARITGYLTDPWSTTP